ncbi:MAG: tetratricopeptide repeat protein [Methylococcaceae bacterium]
MTDLTLCPVCQQDHRNAPLCPHCGFDLADYAFANTKQQKELLAAHRNTWVGHASVVETPSPITETKIKRADNPMEFVEYQAAVNMAWADKKLEAFEVNHLNVLAQKLNLSLEQTETIERDIIGRSVREECYCAMLLAARNTHDRFSLSKLIALPTLQRKTGLSANVTRQLEQALLGQTLLAAVIQQLKKDADLRVELEALLSGGDLASQLKIRENQWAKWNLAAQQGGAEGQCLMGLIAENIDGNNQNAFEWYGKAAEQGHAAGQCNLGTMYLYGKGVSESDSEAVNWYRKAAEQGHARGQCNLGVMYEFGKGVSQSDSEAANWYRKAAEQGDASGQCNFGTMYLHGKGVSESDSEAVNWYRKAAEQGDVRGQCNLGIMYENGIGVGQSDSEAVNWYRKAAEQGDAPGQCNLGTMYENGKGVGQSDSEAVSWYRKAAEQGNAKGQYHLGIMYQKGRGVKKDKDEAKRWYQQAAAQGHKEAQEKLDACFITTATINALGITNGETVLNQFRTFRDEWLSQQAFGAAAIARYYDIAPRYIDLINQQADAAAVYHWLWSDYLASCHNQLQQNDYRAAYHTYRSMLAALSQGFPELD